MESYWKKWNELKAIAKGKKIILWGRAEDWGQKTIPKLPEMPAYIVDINEGYTGTEFSGLTVHLPEKIKEEDPNKIYIVITAGPYESVIEQMDEFGLSAGKHYCCTPAYYDFKLIKEINEYERKILVACPDYEDKKKHRYSKLGGGLYQYSIGPNEVKKIIPGHFRQMVYVDDHVYALEYVERKLYILDKALKVVETHPLDKPNTCGITYCPKRKLVFITNAASDTVRVYEKEGFKLIDTIEFSDKYKRSGIGQHHINDICIVGDYLYASYFSFSGNWKRGIFDGGVIEFDIDNMTRPPVDLVRDLWMPHSVEFIDGALTYLDSMRGYLYIGNQSVAGHFPGFARGLTYDGRFYYVGQSVDMYMSRLFGISDNIMLNAGFYMFDRDTKVSRFYNIKDMVNVHDLLVLP